MVLLFVVCGWREEAMAGVFLRTYLVHSTYVFLYQGYDIRFYCEAPHYTVCWEEGTPPPKTVGRLIYPYDPT